MRSFSIYIFSILMVTQTTFTNSNLFSQVQSVEFNNTYFFYPSELFILEKKENDILYIKSKKEEIYSFIMKLHSPSLNHLLNQFLHAIIESNLIVPEELYLLQQKEYNISPKLNYVGCLEYKFKQCFEIQNFHYSIKDILLEIVLEQSKTTEELRNLFISFFKKNQNILKDLSKKTHLFFRIKLKIIESNKNEFFFIVSITPKHLYTDSQYYMNLLSYTLNIIPQSIKPIPYEEVLEIKPTQVNFLFVINDAHSMKNYQKLLKSQLTHFFDKLQTLNTNFSIGILSTNQCKLQAKFTDDIKIIEKSIKLANQRNLNSCIYYIEMFLKDPECNESRLPKPLSILCITNEWDQYNVLTTAPLELQKNILRENQIPFYALVPLNHKGMFENCKDEKKIQNSHSKNSINLWKLARSTNSSIFNLCKEDYKIYLEEFAMDSVFKFSSLKLERIPLPHSIEILHGEKKIEPYQGKNIQHSENTFYLYSESENSILLIGKPIEGRLKISYLTLEY